MFDYIKLKKRLGKSLADRAEVDFLISPLRESLQVRQSLVKAALSKGVTLDLDHFLRASLMTQTYDVISSFMTLHWVSEVRAYLSQIHDHLSSKGAFQGCFVGGESLKEMRLFFMHTELEVCGKVYPRFSPLIEAPVLMKLLASAGFCDIVVDSEVCQIEYASYDQMMRDLRASGQTNCLASTPAFFPKKLARVLRERFDAHPVPARFEIIYWSCFKS